MSHLQVEECTKGELTFLCAMPARKSQKPPIVFVHGASVGAWCWEEFLKFFARKGYPAYALDLPGHGRSSPLPDLGSAGIQSYVAHVRLFLDDVVRAPAIVVGHSMGGLIVPKLLEEYQALRMVLIAPAPPHGVRYVPGHAVDVSWGAALAGFFGAVQGKPIWPDRALVAQMFESLKNNPVKQDELYARFGPESSKAGEEVLFGHIEVDPTKIPAPRLVIGAGKDGIIHPDVVHGVAQFFDVEATMFPDHGHMLIWEPGWKVVARTILRFTAGRP
jgi:non-heme chloroperoxidase